MTADPVAANSSFGTSRRREPSLPGGGLGSVVVATWATTGAYALAGGVSMVAAAIAPLLRQPGHDRDGARTAQPQAAG
ncbi:hypothetical protein ACFYWX_00485 [Streptomyces sp. NPDC002888]|uniref:hypothetical protein n=1 Tax=Streptomyces sp. NPDC002888 TaxID=3364668 RepID=UPI00367B6C68